MSALGVRILSGVACVCIASGAPRHSGLGSASTACSAGSGSGTDKNGGKVRTSGAGGGCAAQHHHQQQHASFGTSARTRASKPIVSRRRCVASRAVLRHQSTAEGVSYEIHPVAGDGRCLFRSVAAARALRGSSTTEKEQQQQLRHGQRLGEAEESAEADRLREAAVDELVRRRSEVEWFVEGNFDRYCQAMRQPRTWGGEPEILMLTHVLRAPIEVFIIENNLAAAAAAADDDDDATLRSIAHYGQDDYADALAAGEGVAVLFHGAGHYEALSPCEPPLLSKL